MSDAAIRYCCQVINALFAETMTWDNVVMEQCDDSVPRARAGHCAVAVSQCKACTYLVCIAVERSGGWGQGKWALVTKTYIVGYSDWLIHLHQYSSYMNTVMQKSIHVSTSLWLVGCWQLIFVGIILISFGLLFLFFFFFCLWWAAFLFCHPVFFYLGFWYFQPISNSVFILHVLYILPNFF